MNPSTGHRLRRIGDRLDALEERQRSQRVELEQLRSRIERLVTAYAELRFEPQNKVAGAS